MAEPSVPAPETFVDGPHLLVIAACAAVVFVVLRLAERRLFRAPPPGAPTS